LLLKIIKFTKNNSLDDSIRFFDSTLEIESMRLVYNNLSKLNVDIILQDISLLKNINNTYRYKDKF
jgi:hypothetical protein